MEKIVKTNDGVGDIVSRNNHYYGETLHRK